MADPTGYAVDYDFSNEAIPLENEFANIGTAVSSLVAGVKDVRRADGKLRNGIVTLESLSGAVLSTIATGEIPVDLGEADALSVAFSPTGGIAATNVQAAIAEVDAEKAALGHTHDATTIALNPITDLVALTVQAAIAELRLLGARTGDVWLTIDDTAPTGWLMADDGTIGDGSSGADHVGAAYQALYTLLWNKVSDTYAPVSSGRGATAAADWAAHKSMRVTKLLGRVLGVAGAGATLTERATGQTIGVETVVLDATMIPSHSHSVTDPGHTHTLNPAAGNQNTALANSGGSGRFISDGTPSAVQSATTGISIQNTGGGGSHNNMQPSTFLHARIKL